MTTFGKRLLSLLLAAAMILGLLPALTTPEVEAATVSAETTVYAEKDIVALRDLINNLQWPVAVKTDPRTLSNMNGYWLVVVPRYQSTSNIFTVNADAGQFEILEDAADYHYALGVDQVSASGITDVMHSPKQKHIMTLSGTTTSFSICTYNNKYLKTYKLNSIERWFDFKFTSAGDATKFKISENGDGFKMQDSSNYVINANGHTFRVHKTAHVCNFYFYRFSDLTIGMRFAMLNVLPYLIYNSEGRFDTAAHNALLEATREMAEVYKTYYDMKESAFGADGTAALRQSYDTFQAALAAVKDSDKGDTLANLRGKLQSARWPYAEWVKDKNKITTGHWLILGNPPNYEGIERNPMKAVSLGEQYTWSGAGADPTTTAVHRGFGLSDTTIYGMNGIPLAITPNIQSILTLQGNVSGFTIRAFNGNYLNASTPAVSVNGAVGNGDLKFGSATTFKAEAKTETKSNTPGWFSVFDTVGNYLWINGYSFRLTRKTYTENGKTHSYSDDQWKNKMRFYKLNEEALQLRLAMMEGLNYLVEDYATRFDKAAFDNLVAALTDAEEKYEVKVVATDSTLEASEKAEFQQKTTAILEAIAGLSVGEAFDTVLDSGKTVEVDLSKINSSLTCTGNAKLSHIGYTLDGTHGAVSTAKPSLAFSAKGQSIATEQYRLSMQTVTKLRFTPTTFMNTVTTIYAVYQATVSSNITTFATCYVRKAINILPATSVYYESDFAQSIHKFDTRESLFIDFGVRDTTAWEGFANVSSNLTKTGGVLKGTYTGSDPHIQMTSASCIYNYVIKPDDVVKVRIKSDAGTGTNLEVFFQCPTNPTPLSPTGGISTEYGAYTPDGKYQVVTMKIKPEAIGKTVKGVRLDPIVNYGGKNGNFEYDWVYIGPDVEVEPYLVVGFGENDTTEWEAEASRNATAKKEGGFLKGEIIGPDPNVRMSVASSNFNYVVKENDVVRVRIKSHSCTGDGLQVFFMCDTNPEPPYPTEGISTEIAEYEPNNDWQIVTLPILPEVVGKTVRGLRLDPIGNNESFNSKGSYEIDWIYVGPQEEVKAPILINFDETDST